MKPAVHRRITGLLLIGLPLLPLVASARPPGVDEIDSLIAEALSDLHEGRLVQAAEGLRHALRSLDDASPAALRADLWLKLAHIEVNLGKYRPGLDAAIEALTIFEALHDSAGEAAAHLRIGAAHDELAEYDASNRHYNLALEGFRGQGDRFNEARTLSALGTSCRFLGDPGKAAAYYQRAVELFSATDSKPFVSWEHRNLGTVLEDLDRPAEAQAEYRRALELLPPDQDWRRAIVLFDLGRLSARSDEPGPAAALLQGGLALARTSQNTWAEALIQVEQARLLGRLGEPVAGVGLAESGAELLAWMGARDLEWEARLVRASLLERAGDFERARSGYRAALDILEEVRASIGVPLLRTRYTPRVQSVYESLLRVEARHPSTADPGATALLTFRIAEGQRARTFGEMLLESRIAPEAGESSLRREERALRGKINALHTQLIRRDHGATDPEELERELLEAERQHSTIVLELRSTDPRFRDPSTPPAFTVSEASEILGDRADLLAYHLGDTASFAWHLGRGELRLFELPPRSEIESLILFYRGLVRQRNDDHALRRVSRRLYDVLIGPMTSRLVVPRTLVVVPDGALFHLPFEALLLPDGSSGARPYRRHGSTPRYVIQEHSVYYVPSLAVLEELRRRAVEPNPLRERDLLAFGDPLLRPRGPEPSLIHAGAEIERIGRLFGAARSVERTRAAATESAFRELVARPTRILHVATHGTLDGERIERSGLVFAPEAGGQGDGFLNLFEVFGLRLAADLVVLSACETARGELLRGEGLLGLTRGFLLAGARAVVASQWQVDDRSTEELMVAFYEELLQGRSAADSLRRAKVGWIERAGPDRADPFSWAGFVLVGDGDMVLELGAAVDLVGWSFLSLGVLLMLSSFVTWAGARHWH